MNLPRSGTTRLVGTHHRLKVVCYAEKFVRRFDVVVDLSRDITQLTLEVIMSAHSKALLLCHGNLMFGDGVESIPRVDENAPGMMKPSPQIMKVLLVREVDLKLLIRVWYGNLLVLRIATTSAAVKIGTGRFWNRVYSREAVVFEKRSQDILSNLQELLEDIEDVRTWDVSSSRRPDRKLQGAG